MFDEDRQQEAAAFQEGKEMVTTVLDKLEYTAESIAPYFDVLVQKETTNQHATANLMVDGIEIAKDLPATFLLGLENRLKIVRGVYEQIPTLAPGIKWEKDPTRPNTYRTEKPEVTSKTEKTFIVKVLYEATKEHPAQVEKIPENATVGLYEKQTWCGMLSPAEKSDLLGRIDRLIRAVKQARQRANNTEVVNVKIGEKLFNFINKGTV